MNKVLRAKYFSKGGLLNAEVKGQDSWLQKSWIGAKSLLLKDLRYQVGNEKLIKIWDSPWLPSTPNFKPMTLKPKGCSTTQVSELMQEKGRSWNGELLHQIFNKCDVEQIIQTLASQLGTQDKLVWQYTRNGMFSMNSACYWLSNHQNINIIVAESSTCKAQEKSIWKRM